MKHIGKLKQQLHGQLVDIYSHSIPNNQRKNLPAHISSKFKKKKISEFWKTLEIGCNITYGRGGRERCELPKHVEERKRERDSAELEARAVADL